MRASTTVKGLTVRVIAGTYSAIVAMDLQENKRKGCLGFTIRREDLDPPGPGEAARPGKRALPNMLRFPGDTDETHDTTEDSPLQKFRWGDYTLRPGRRYRYTVVPKFGKPGKLEVRDDVPGASVEVTTEDNQVEETAVFFNRAAAASEAFNRRFPKLKTLEGDSDEAKEARAWLSHGLEEAILAYLAKAKEGDALHAAIYEFQKDTLLAGLRAAVDRGVDVKVVYHAREKGDTAEKNRKAIEKAGLGEVVIPRTKSPQAIMHDKFVVWLRKDGNADPKPVAVWTGSTNWTDGGLYGQLNVGHAVYEPGVAATYEALFQLLAKDREAPEMKHALASLTPVSETLPGTHKVMPVFSPQGDDTMLRLYAAIAGGAKMLMVSAPFEISPLIRKAITRKSPGVLRFLLLDKMSSLGKSEEVTVIQGDPANSIAVATTLKSPLHDFQKKLLGDKESFHHAGIHIHSKIIMADPFGSDPIIVTGSANFSNNSTEVNDSNTLVLRGYTAVADIYATEFMRMFEHYHFRAKRAASEEKERPLGLAADDSWSDKYYVAGSTAEQDRRMFAGTM